MALSTSSLRDRIKSKVEAATGNTLPDLAVDVWEAVAEAIIEEITTSAVVTTASGCTAGGAAGTGTIG
jgi:hypothetical protein